MAGSYMPLFVKVLKHDTERLQVTCADVCWRMLAYANDTERLQVTGLSAIMDALLVFRQVWQT